jgi:uncharacterized protein (DUF1499 family)
MKNEFGILVLAMLLSACAATPTSNTSGTTEATDTADLSCGLPSNCVSSQGSGVPAPLQYSGTPAQALDMLRTTVASFPEATVVRADALSLELIFTTPAGFRDQVDFRIDPKMQRIDFRSRSLAGLFDFGKNRSRMKEFSSRFEQQSRR